MVKDWFREWKGRQRAKVPLGFGRWPDDQAEGWDVFFQAFRKAEASEETGQAVTDLMAENPPRDLNEATRQFKAALEKVIKSKGASGGMSRDEAHAASQSMSRDQYGDPMPCQVCGGEGIGQFRRADGEPFEVKTAAGLRRRMDELPMACPVCPMGRWMAAHNKTLPDAQLYGDRVMTRLDYYAPAEADEPRDVRAELRRGINATWGPARAG